MLNEILPSNPCACCSQTIEVARVELGLKVCLRCAKHGRHQGVYKGAMVFEHKTAGALQIMNAETFTDFKAKTSRRGQSSALRNVMVAGGRLQ